MSPDPPTRNSSSHRPPSAYPGRSDGRTNIRSLHPRNVLGFHGEMPGVLGRQAVQKHAAKLRFFHRYFRPEEWREKSDRTFEIGRVEEQSPAVIAGGYILAIRLVLGIG